MSEIDRIIESYVEDKDDKNKLLEDFYEKYYDIFYHSDIGTALIKDMEWYTEGVGFSDCRNFVKIINKKYENKIIYYLEKELMKIDIERIYISVKKIESNIYKLKFEYGFPGWIIYLKYENNMFECIYSVTWNTNGKGPIKYYLYKNKNENIDIIEKKCEIISKEEILKLEENLEIDYRNLVIYDKNDYEKVIMENVNKLITNIIKS